MKIFLAGMNLDTETIRELHRLVQRSLQAMTEQRPPGGDFSDLCQELAEFSSRDNLTPETLSAAYARISRDPRPVDELRADARQQVDRARKSNESIIFGVGHASVAEHAVFNLDILEISRLAAEYLEHFRLASYTEKSQRYVKLNGDFVIPGEIRDSPLEKEYLAVVEKQNRAYREVFERLQEYFARINPELTASPAGRRMLEGWAKEDARYCLGLATETQLGMTANARSLERIIQKCLVHQLAEIRELGAAIYRAVHGVAPSVIKYIEPEAHHRFDLPMLHENIRRCAEQRGILAEFPGPVEEEPAACRLITSSSGGEQLIFAAIAHEALGLPFADCQRWAQSLDEPRRQALLSCAFRQLEPYQALPRAFEMANFLFELVVSAACFGQLKRHRMGTLTVQTYDPELGLVVPPSMQEAGLETSYRALAARSAEVFDRIRDISAAAAPYILLNGHRRRVLCEMNFRELAHFSRLRLDQHAQWDIRRLAGEMIAQTKARMPQLGILLCGKDQFAEARETWRGGDPGECE